MFAARATLERFDSCPETTADDKRFPVRACGKQGDATGEESGANAPPVESFTA